MKQLMMAIIAALLLAACNAEPPSAIPYSALPETGDPVRGATLYAEDSSPLCTSCHVADATGAPTLENYAQEARSRVEGQSAREYTFYAITEPWQHIVEGYGDAMPYSYDDDLSAQDIADLIAYLLQEE